MLSLAKRIQKLAGKTVDTTAPIAARMTSAPTEPLAERVRTLAMETVKGIPKAAGDLAIESAKQTGKGLGILWESLSVPEQPARYIGIPDKKKQMTRAEKIPQIDPTGMIGSVAKTGEGVAKTVPKVFEGFKDISTRLLEKLKGKSVTSRTEIENLTNMPELKQAERDLIRNALVDEGDKVDVSAFAEKVKAELLPLERGIIDGDFQKLEDVDRHIQEGDIYKDIPPFSVSNERYAYLGTLAMEGGLEAIPEPLRRFYVGVIKDQSLNEDGTPKKKSRTQTKEF